jgi:hypothetical protein
LPFRYSERHREEYLTDGLTILRGLIPPALLSDLRREADRAREIARREHGAQTQRLQPVYAYEEIDARPFREFLDLPGLRETVEKVLGESREPSDNMGILLEPAESPWSTNWHRDWGHHIPGLGQEEFFEAARNLKTFNQLNAALYQDASLWVVPGSHCRANPAEERAAFPDNPPAGPDLREGMTREERELACREYARSRPGGVEVVLGAGDVAFYRAGGWHLGAYVPYTRRATLHDGFYGEDDYAWLRRMREFQEAQSR